MKTIDDAIYHVSPEIIRHRYNPLLGIVLTALSIFLLWANSNSAIFEQNDMFAQWNLLFSSCLLCAGLTMICYRFFGDSSAPVDKKNRERLYRSEYSFEQHDLPRVRTAIESGDFTLLQTLPRSFQPAAQVVCYRTDSGSMIAAQVLVNREPTCEVRIYRAGEYEF